MKHGVWRVVAILLLVLAGLWLLQCLPGLTFLGKRLEPVRLLSSLTATDTVAQIVVVQDSGACPEGIVCIDDAEGERSHGMEHLYKALYALKQHPERKVRIAFYGDSFIEADIITGELRRLLQEAYGGSGVGFLALRSDRNDAYRSTVSVVQNGWEEYEMVQPKAQPANLGIAGLYLKGQPNAYTEVHSKEGQAWDETAVYYTNTPAAATWQCTAGTAVLSQTQTTHGSVCMAKAEGRTEGVRWQLTSTSPEVVFWGMSVEGKGGIVLDNFSMRGETGLSLLGMSDERLADFQTLRPYDLIIFQYGLNVITNKSINTTNYFDNLRKAIGKFKRAFPHSSILIFGLSDRAQRQQGIYATMPTLQSFVATQRQMAQAEDLAFWDTYTAMQIDGGIVGYVNASPRCAAKDYTHVNHAGGARIAKHLFEAIRVGAERYANAQHTAQSAPTP